MKNTIVINVESMPLIKQAIERAIKAVEIACTKSGVSSVGFSIDGTFCDWGIVDTSGVMTVIDSHAQLFGRQGSGSYSTIVEYLCEAINKNFAEQPVSKFEQLRAWARGFVGETQTVGESK